LPKAGGAIRGLGEKFGVTPSSGAGSFRVPVAASPGRSDFGPQFALTYDSGSGNATFGFGWNLPVTAITRRTDKGLPRYLDDDESDTFLLAGAEDLVPVLDGAGKRISLSRTVHGVAYAIRPYRPRVEGTFARIERWTNQATGISHWRTITQENVISLFGLDEQSRIADPQDPRHVFSYLIAFMADNKGNAMRYRYVPEDPVGVDLPAAHEANRGDAARRVQRYVKTIEYGNVQPYFPDWTAGGVEAPMPADWHFKLVFDYGDHAPDAPTPDRDRPWPVRPDPFSVYRSGFEIRTYRRCRRILMFHNFPAEAGVGDWRRLSFLRGR